jgi:DNA-binding transcriptional LysR family regulator
VELKLLRSFVILSEELHFGRAAKRLCIVQPALTAQLKGLEAELGVRLFDRDHHRVELSEAGRAFLPGAKATLDQAQQAIDVMRAVDRGEVGRIRVGFVSSVLPWYLPMLARQLRLRFPGIELELKDMPTPEQIRALRAGELDFGIVRLPVDATQIVARALFDEPFVVAVPEEHPFADRERLNARDLAGQPCFVLARRFAPGFHDELLLAFAQRGVSLQIDRTFGEFTSMAALVGAGLGVGLIPQLALHTPPAGVVLRPIDLGSHVSHIGLVWRALDTAVARTFHAVAIEMTAAAG